MQSEPDMPPAALQHYIRNRAGIALNSLALLPPSTAYIKAVKIIK